MLHKGKKKLRSFTATDHYGPSESPFPLSVYPTFDFGADEVTTFTYRSILVESKSKNMTGVWVPATMIRPFAIQHEKSTETKETVMRCIAKKCKLEESGELFIGTNGEAALILVKLCLIR